MSRRLRVPASSMSWARPLLVPVFLISLAIPIIADPATLPFTDCFNGNASAKFSIDKVYGQVLTTDQTGTYLNLTVIGSSPQEIFGFVDSSSSLATLFTTTTVLTLNVWSNSSYLCNTIRPASPLPVLDNSTANYCPIQAGPFALSSTIPWGEHRHLTTLNTRLRAVDPFSNELLCLSVNTTPLTPTAESPYGVARGIFWATVGLAMGYWVIIGIARLVSAWGRGTTRPGRSLWARVQSAGFILASAISGERFATSPALMRFSTPCMRDVIFHTQWCAALAMVAVQWPDFAYPLLAQTSWATLSYNITLTNHFHWNPLFTLPYDPPSTFSSQLADPTSAIHVNSTAPNILFTLPSNATMGMSMFAYTIGVRPRDLWGICMILFLAILAATIVLSAIVWFIDFIGGIGTGTVSRPGRRARSPGPKELEMSAEESKVAMFRPSSRLALSGTFGNGTSWYRIRTEMSSFHWSVLAGNLVRILVLFHLPITIFSSFQMTQSNELMRTRALAALSFAFCSVVVPVYLVIRVTLTTTNKLYDETRTLLAFGPLYNHYRHGSQLFASLLFATNIVFGVVIGAGQKSGTAQAVVILVAEVVSALVTSIWLPWGTGASMGLISFLFCVARIVVAVLLVILTPAISIGDGAGAWVAYGILVILALVYLALSLMLLIKLIEGAVRIVGRVGFDRSNHAVDSGLLGACGLLGCCGARKRHHGKSRSSRPSRAETAHSEGSTVLLPPAPLESSNGKGSIHSQHVPSVLRPEHALRPYREESDDESGYIMGAWQPFPRPGYQVVKDTAPSSGFSRVGGGRAHIDTPYAIQSKTALASSSSTPTLEWPTIDDDEAPPVSSVMRPQRSETNVPRGAMLPHMRTKSQTAIIEDATPLAAVATLHPVSAADEDDDDDDHSDVTQRRKKPWYHIRRHRPHSDGAAPSSFPAAAVEQAAAATSDVPAGRSFVVIRKGGQASPGRSAQLSMPTDTRPASSG
ncbi:unnamed protein product [Mycena citricolor]|uniref:TRP C-terminal domain-containing protein n=1 Tax=Mycena citricolor TaxID=2018698 RepID=A0AAD2HHN9_9AGAR|nr:unnamed protein product [Mycena citricolor]CAK5275134.1 unnamed protein product [Mycena citricolor]